MNERTRFTTGHVIYNPTYTYKFQLKTTLEEFLGRNPSRSLVFKQNSGVVQFGADVEIAVQVKSDEKLRVRRRGGKNLHKVKFSEKTTKIEKIFTVNLTVCSNRQINGEDFDQFLWSS